MRGSELGMVRLVRLALLAVFIAATALVTTAAAGPPACTHGVSSVGPAVVVNGHLARNQSDLTPHAESCVP
jgi:hypothetical protein